MVAIGIGVGVVFGGAVPAPFTPLDLSPALWLDASDATTITASSGAVSEWRDRSGNARHVSQGTAAAQPTTGAATINGLNVLNFDGGDALNASVAPSSILLGATGATLLIVCKLTADPPTATVRSGPPFGKWGTGFAGEEAFPFTDGKIYLGWARTTRPDIGNPSPSMAANRAYAFTSTNNSWQMWIDGGTPYNTTTSSTFGLNTNNLIIGQGSVYLFDGLIAEMVVYNGVLSTANLNKVGDYLAAKWGVSWSAVS